MPAPAQPPRRSAGARRPGGEPGGSSFSCFTAVGKKGARPRRRNRGEVPNAPVARGEEGANLAESGGKNQRGGGCGGSSADTDFPRSVVKASAVNDHPPVCRFSRKFSASPRARLHGAHRRKPRFRPGGWSTTPYTADGGELTTCNTVSSHVGHAGRTGLFRGCRERQTDGSAAGGHVNFFQEHLCRRSAPAPCHPASPDARSREPGPSHGRGGRTPNSEIPCSERGAIRRSADRRTTTSIRE